MCTKSPYCVAVLHQFCETVPIYVFSTSLHWYDVYLYDELYIYICIYKPSTLHALCTHAMGLTGSHLFFVKMDGV